MALRLNPTGKTLTGEQIDGSIVQAIEYERVLIELTPESNEVWATSVHPVVLTAPNMETNAAPGVLAVIDTSRLLGHGGIYRLGLKQEFVQCKLVKVLRRI